jgi:hypothetical protein
MLTRQIAILQAPPGPWPKVTAFAIGLTAALGLGVFIGPRSAAGRPSAIAPANDPPIASRAIASPAPSAAVAVEAPPPATGLEAKPSDQARTTASAAVADHPSKRAAHKPSRAKQHAAKRRGASKR